MHSQIGKKIYTKNDEGSLDYFDHAKFIDE